MENDKQMQLTEEDLENASGGMSVRMPETKKVTIKCGKCGKLLRVSFGMNARCPDPNCQWVTIFSPDLIVTD